MLQPTYRVEVGGPVVHLYGRLEDGRSMLVREHRQVPFFYVEASQAERARALGARPLAATGKHTLSGAPVLRVETATPADVPPLRRRLAQAGIACHEADIRFALRFLMERGIRGSFAVTGAARSGSGVAAVFDDPQLAPADWTPRLSVLSFDIETDPGAQRLLSIALHGCGASRVLLLTPPGKPCPVEAEGFATEKALLQAFARCVQELDPDVLTGWNVVDFDLAVLERIALRLRVPLVLGRGAGALRLRSLGSSGWSGTRQASIPGRVVLDGIQLLRGAFVRMDDYGLDAVAKEVLGEGKSITGRGRAQEVLRLYEQDRARLVEYNRTDARLALEILQRLRLVELAVERSRLTGLPLDRVSASIAAFDFLYLSELGRRGFVAPSVREDGTLDEPTGGGHVLEPVPGLATNVIVLDFKSLYPSLIRSFGIDPLGLQRAAGGEPDPILAPNGAAFSRTRGILPGLLDEIMPQRDAAKAAGDSVKSHAVKILMNSFYGVLATPACRFYDPRLANAITSFGREVLLWCKARIEASGLAVVYGDTDSLFVASAQILPERAHAAGVALAERLTRELAEHVRVTWNVESRLHLQFDRLYLKLCLLTVRHGTSGARKRYAGLVADKAGVPRVVFTGMEAVRGDWTPLAKQVQRELYTRLFTDKPVAEYLRGLVAELRAGVHDAELVYRKGLRKAPADYRANTPPHVAAARKQGRTGRGRVSYVMTTAGPEPAGDVTHPIDHEHYVAKQVQPVAEPVLALLGLDFARVIGDVKQLSLFD